MDVPHCRDEMELDPASSLQRPTEVLVIFNETSAKIINTSGVSHLSNGLSGRLEAAHQQPLRTGDSTRLTCTAVGYRLTLRAPTCRLLATDLTAKITA